MQKKELLYEGKAKKVYKTEDPEVYIVSYKDDATAFNGLKKGTIVGKGVVNNEMSNFMFRMLEKEGIPTHYIEELNERETAVKKVAIVPLEVIIRNVAAGSLSKRLGLPEGTEKLYPFQLSGGMARRVLVATALLADAQLLIADEPTPGMSLDQALEALRLFRAMADEGRAVVLITHDVDLAVAFADRVAVFYAGTTVEIAPAADFRAGAEALRHPYSQALWRALPQNGFVPIPGFQPYAGNLPKGCVFAPRCPRRTAACEAGVPPMRPVRGGEVRCLYGA